MSAADVPVSDDMARHFRTELRTGKSRKVDRELTEGERVARIAALRTYSLSLSPKWRGKLQRELESFEESLKALQEQSAQQHAAVVAQAEAHHSEALEQISGVHAKLDEFSGAGLSILRAMESGELMPRTGEQSDAERIRQLRTLKQIANNEIAQLQEAETVRKATRLAGIRQGGEVAAVHAAALHQDIAGIEVDDVEPAEALAKIKDWEESQKKIAQGLRKDVRAAAKAKAKGKAKGRAKGKARAASSAPAAAPDDDASPRSASSASTGTSSSASSAPAAGASPRSSSASSAGASAAPVAASEASSDADDEGCPPRGQKREMAEAPAHEILGGTAPPADELEPLVKKPFDLRAVVRQRQEEEAARLRLIEEEYNQCAPAADTV
jgi:hypothetical protein